MTWRKAFRGIGVRRCGIRSGPANACTFHRKALCGQQVALLVCAARHDAVTGAEHAVPRHVVVGSAEVVPDRASGSGMAGLGGNLAVGQHLTRPQGAQHLPYCCFERGHPRSVFRSCGHRRHTASVLDDLLAANARYAAAFDAADLPPEPARRLLLVTCMDARIDPLKILGLQIGDVHVLRNAGGRVTDDVIRSLVVSTRLLGVTSVVVMHHTQCGMAKVSQGDVPAILSDVDEQHLEGFELLAIADQEQALRDDVNAVQDSPLLPEIAARGLLYDVATGLARHLG